MSHKNIPIHEEEEIEIRVEKDDLTEEVEDDEDPGNGNTTPIARTDVGLTAADQVQLLSRVMQKQFADFKDSLGPILAPALEEKVLLKHIGHQKQFDFNNEVVRQIKLARNYTDEDKGPLT